MKLLTVVEERKNSLRFRLVDDELVCYRDHPKQEGAPSSSDLIYPKHKGFFCRAPKHR